MKKSLTLATILVMIAAWAVLFTKMPERKTSKMTVHDRDGDLSEGTKENPNAAAEYEFNRLKDPATGMMPFNMRIRELEFAASLPKDIDLNSEKTMPPVWASRGPYNIGGRTRALGVDINNDSILLAGGVSSNMWRSTDQGGSWTSVSNPNQLHNVTCIEQDKRAGHTNTWYYGTGEGYGASAYANGAFPLGNGVFKSTDNGLSWTSLPSTASNAPQSFVNGFQICWDIATDPTAPDTSDIVYAALYGGIRKSVNGGLTWTNSLFNNNSYFSDIAIGNNGVKYATLSSDGTLAARGIRRSVDGNTWTKITPDSFPTVYNRIVIGIDPNNENNVYFLAVTPGAGFPSTMNINYQTDTEYYSLWKYTYISGNGDSAGGSWVNLSANIPYNGSEYGNYYAQGGYDMFVKVKPGNSNVVFIGGTDMFRSTDGFTTPNNWVHVGGYAVGTTAPDFYLYPNQHPDQHNIRFSHSNPNIMFSCADGGIFKTMNCLQTDSISWISMNRGYVTTQFYTCSIDHATPNNEIIIGGLQDNGSFFTNTTNFTSPWTWSSKGDGAYCFVLDGHNTYYFSRQQAKVFKFNLDPQGNPLSFTRIDPIGGAGYLFVAPFAVDPNNNNIMYLADSNHIWRNTDLSVFPFNNLYDTVSTNWQVIDSATGAGQITAVSVSTVPANRMYFGTLNNKIYRVDNANTGNPVKVDITSTHFTNGASVSCLAVDPTNADRVLAVFSNYSVKSLFFTSNGGTTWKDVSNNLEQFVSGTGNGPSCRWASILPVNGDTAYLVGTSTGIYATAHMDSVKLDTANHVWVQLGWNTIGNAVVDMIDTRVSDGLVVVATHGNGMFSTNITDIAQITGINTLKTLTSPLQLRNYPNPADEFTYISFNLPKRTHVEMKIFDIKGNEIATLYNGVKEGGLENILFDTKKLASGVYFCHIVAGELSETKRIVVVHN
jgi:photosystem II stability/assembly factor-like uncharacterized protein